MKQIRAIAAVVHPAYADGFTAGVNSVFAAQPAKRGKKQPAAPRRPSQRRRNSPPVEGFAPREVDDTEHETEEPGGV